MIYCKNCNIIWLTYPVLSVNMHYDIKMCSLNIHNAKQGSITALQYKTMLSEQNLLSEVVNNKIDKICPVYYASILKGIDDNNTISIGHFKSFFRIIYERDMVNYHVLKQMEEDVNEIPITEYEFNTLSSFAKEKEGFIGIFLNELSSQDILKLHNILTDKTYYPKTLYDYFFNIES